MPIETFLPQRSIAVSHELNTSRPPILQSWLNGKGVERIAGNLHRSQYSIRQELWQDLGQALESSRIKPEIIQESLKSRRLPFSQPVPPAYALKPWLTEIQWKVFEQLGQGLSYAAAAEQLGLIPHQVYNLGIQIRDVLSKKGLDIPRHSRILALAAQAVQEAMPDVERQLMLDAVDSGHPVKVSSKNLHRENGKRQEIQDWVTIFDKYPILFHTRDRQHYMASLQIETVGGGTVWLNLAELTLNRGASRVQTINGSTESSLAIISRIEEILRDYIDNWEKGQREKDLRAAKHSTTSYPNGKEISEQELILEVQEGDPAAQEELYNRFISRLQRYALAITGDLDLAQDIAQDVLIKAIGSIGNYRERGNPFSAWLFSIAKNAIINNHRYNKSRPTTVELPYSLAQNGAGPEELAVEALSLEEAWSVLPRLSDNQRQVIELRFVADLSIAETALVLGRSQSNVKSSQRQAIARLRKILGGN